MKGLLCKDWAILVNSYKKNFLIMVVLYLGMAVCLHMDYLCYAYKFGAVRAGTWVYLVTFFGVFLIIFAMEHLPYLQRSSVISQLDALGNALAAQPVLLLLPSAAVLLLYLGSWALSVQIYQRKEF